MFERKILRKIFGPTKGDKGNWRIKTNKEMDELIKHRNIINYVKAQRLSWFGHINRMPETSIVKKIYKWKPFTRRPAGRSKSRWEDDVRNDLKKMKCIHHRRRRRNISDQPTSMCLTHTPLTCHPNTLCNRHRLLTLPYQHISP